MPLGSSSYNSFFPSTLSELRYFPSVEYTETMRVKLREEYLVLFDTNASWEIHLFTEL